MRTSITRLIIAAAVATVAANGSPLPGHWQPLLCPRNPSRTDMSPRFLRPTFISVIINSLEAISSTDRATA